VQLPVKPLDPPQAHVRCRALKLHDGLALTAGNLEIRFAIIGSSSRESAGNTALLDHDNWRGTRPWPDPSQIYSQYTFAPSLKLLSVTHPTLAVSLVRHGRYAWFLSLHSRRPLSE
jgi:hypothetical protein